MGKPLLHIDTCIFLQKYQRHDKMNTLTKNSKQSYTNNVQDMPISFSLLLFHASFFDIFP